MFVNHVHLFPDQVKPEGTLDVFLHLCDALGIEGGVCFAPFSYQVEPLGIDHNEWLAQTIAKQPQLIGYGTLDPLQEPTDQVRRIAELGFRGIKLHSPAQKFDLFGSWARKAYEAMEAHNLIADFHLGVHWHRLKAYDPMLCDEIAHHYPNLRMVYEHVGGWHFYKQVLAVITNNKTKGDHLYAGIASVLDRERQKHWYLGPEGLEDCRWQIGEHLLIYGLDFPYNQLPNVAQDIEVIRAMDWPQADIDACLGGNLKRLLGI